MNIPVISCNIMGGLGNQLFQIMTTISYAIRNKCVFLFPYDTKVMNRYTYWDSFLSNLKQFTTNNFQCKFKKMDLYYFPKYTEPVFHYVPIPQEIKEVCFAFGWIYFINASFNRFLESE